MSGNPLVPILDGNGRLVTVTTYISDQFGPILQSFDINMNTGEMIMTFDEPINRSTIKVSSFTIQNAYSQTISFTLIGTAGSGLHAVPFGSAQELSGGFGPLGYGNILTLTITIDDLNSIKLLTMCTASIISGLPNNLVNE